MKKSLILGALLALLLSCENAIQTAVPQLLTTLQPGCEISLAGDDQTFLVETFYQSDKDIASIELQSLTPEAEIYYTLDRSIPNRNSLRYTGPLSLSGHEEEIYIRAIAYAPPKEPSAVMTYKFNILYQGPPAPSFQVLDMAGQPLEPSTEGTTIYDQDIQIRVTPADYSLDPPSQPYGASPAICYSSFLTSDAQQQLPSVSLEGEVLFGRDMPGDQDFIAARLQQSGTITLSALTYVPGYPVREKRTQSFSVAYSNDIDQLVEISPATGAVYGAFTLDLQPNEAIPTGAQIEYKYTISGVDGTITQESDYLTYDSLNPPDFFASTADYTPQDGDMLSLQSRIVCHGWNTGQETRAIYTLSLGVPQPPEIRITQDGTEIQSGNTVWFSTVPVNLSFEEDPYSEIYYSLDGNNPWQLYSAPIELRDSHGIYDINSHGKYIPIQAFAVRRGNSDLRSSMVQAHIVVGANG